MITLRIFVFFQVKHSTEEAVKVPKIVVFTLQCHIGRGHLTTSYRGVSISNYL